MGKGVFPWVSESELCFSRLRMIWMLNISHWLFPNLCLHLQLPSLSKTFRHGAARQLWLNSPWLSFPQAPCGPTEAAFWAGSLSALPLKWKYLAHSLLFPFPPRCHIPLPSSPSFADKKVWRLEPRGGKEEEEDQSCPFPLILPLKSRLSTNISIYQPVNGWGAAVTVTESIHVFWHSRDWSYQKDLPAAVWSHGRESDDMTGGLELLFGSR